MARSLDLNRLKQDLFKAFKDMISSKLPDEDRRESERTMEILANKISESIDSYVRSGEVTITLGANAKTSQGNKVTGTGKGKIE